MATSTKTIPLAPSVPLKDVEWRVDGKPSEKNGEHRARFVPHVNARIAARLLDEWVGPENWFDEYEVVTIAGKEVMWCKVSVRDSSGNWVSKSDVGTSGTTEPQKALVSDAFKRVVTVKWGCGRNVYELPSLWAPCRVYGQGDNLKAAENDKTIPFLVAELKRKGFDDTDVRVAADVDDVDEAPAPAPKNAAPAKAAAPKAQPEKVAEPVAAAPEPEAAPEPAPAAEAAPVEEAPDLSSLGAAEVDPDAPVTPEIWDVFKAKFGELDSNGRKVLKDIWQERQPGKPLPTSGTSTNGDVLAIIDFFKDVPF